MQEIKLKDKYLHPVNGRFGAGQRTSAARAKTYSNAAMKLRAEDRRHSQEINSHIHVALLLHPTLNGRGMKRTYVRTYV